MTNHTRNESSASELGSIERTTSQEQRSLSLIELEEQKRLNLLKLAKQEQLNITNLFALEKAEQAAQLKKATESRIAPSQRPRIQALQADGAKFKKAQEKSIAEAQLAVENFKFKMRIERERQLFLREQDKLENDKSKKTTNSLSFFTQNKASNTSANGSALIFQKLDQTIMLIEKDILKIGNKMTRLTYKGSIIDKNGKKLTRYSFVDKERYFDLLNKKIALIELKDSLEKQLTQVSTQSISVEKFAENCLKLTEESYPKLNKFYDKSLPKIVRSLIESFRNFLESKLSSSVYTRGVTNSARAVNEYRKVLENSRESEGPSRNFRG